MRRISRRAALLGVVGAGLAACSKAKPPVHRPERHRSTSGPHPGTNLDAQPEPPGRHPATLAAHRQAAEGQEQGAARGRGGQGARQPAGASAARHRRGRHRLRPAGGLPGRLGLQRDPARPRVPLPDARHGRAGAVHPARRHPAAQPDGRDHRQHRRREVGGQLRQALPRPPRGHALVPGHGRHRLVRHRPVARLHVQRPDLLRPRHHLPPEDAGQADQAVPQRTPAAVLPFRLDPQGGQRRPGQARPLGQGPLQGRRLLHGLHATTRRPSATGAACRGDRTCWPTASGFRPTTCW